MPELTIRLADRPDRPAIVYDGGQLTYHELAAAVDEKKARLGRKPGTVPVPVAHRPETVVDLLGIWAAGGTYLPINPAFPPERQRQMLDAAADVPEETAYVLFTSGSTVTHLLDVLCEAGLTFPRQVACVSIGPVTSAALREAGLTVATEAATASLDALVDQGLLSSTDVRFPWADRYYYRRVGPQEFILLPPLR